MPRDPWHEQAMIRVRDKLGRIYKVESPRNLPVQTRSGALYQPDVCAFDRSSDELKYIVEIESQNGRKSIVGAVCLAQICSKDMGQTNKPKLFFILKYFDDQEGIRKLNVRIRKLREMLRNDYLDGQIELISLDDFIGRTL